MISRGEVALIIASKGNALGLISADVFGPVILMIVFTTVITPILLKIAFNRKNEDAAAEQTGNALAEKYLETEKIYHLERPMIDKREEIKEEDKKS